ITGTVPGICHAKGMTSFLYANGIRIFDYPQFAATLRDRLRDNAAKVAKAAGVSIEHVTKSYLRKEDMVAKAIAQRGEHPGLAHVISAMEACGAYEPWHDKKTHKTFLRPDAGKCLHYYFYFIDAELGLIYVRVPTWAPFRLQIYCNGHSWPSRTNTWRPSPAGRCCSPPSRSAAVTPGKPRCVWPALTPRPDGRRACSPASPASFTSLLKMRSS